VQKRYGYLKERLSKSGDANKLFETYHKVLKQAGVITHEGSIVDASFVEAPHQTKGNKDEDATWAKKRNETHYGYKDNIKVDKDSKIITNFTSYNGKSTQAAKK
jgi:hypothetical protein